MSSETASKIPLRDEIDEKDKWAINDIYADDDLWEADLKKAREYGKKISAYKGKLAESAKIFLEFFKLDDELSLIINNLAHYAQRKLDENTQNTKYQDFTGRFMSVAVEINSASAFEVPEIIALSDEKLENFYMEEPELEIYRLAIERIRRRREHILSDAEEKLLAMSGEMSQSPENIYSMFSDADLKFPDVEDSKGENHQLTHGSYIPLVQSPDRVLRKNAFEAMYKVYGDYRNTTAAILSAQCKQLAFYARARKYNSTLEASLDSTEIPVEVYHNLISAVHENMRYMYKYVELRKKLMGIDELHMYDLYTPIIKPDDDKVTFEQAKQSVTEALSPMGKDYLNILREGFDNRWIDVYENVGKCSGAYSAGAKVHPFVLLNYKETLDNQFTLAHEMGHAIHSYLSNKYQPNAYSDYVIFVAEVASTCNEALLMQYLLSKAEDKKARAYLINYFLEQFRTTLYRQTMFAEFELKINTLVEQGESLTEQVLCDIYYELNKLYFGDGIVIDKEIAMEWARIPHFYYDYYVYQYATGYSAAIALSRKILNGGEEAAQAYIEFLKGGNSKTPIELLKGAGVDMTTAEPINEALKLFNELIDEMEELMAD